MIRHPWKKLVSSLVAGLALSAPALAQCPVPDNLDGGPCCAITQLVLPTFPAFSHTALEICWLECNLDQSIAYTACWSQPTQAVVPTGALCSVFLSRLQLKDAAGAVVWNSGPMRMWYARTWVETGAGTNFQVWRFLVNGDLRATAIAGPSPCPVPKCAPAFNNAVHVTGYVDYAMDCSTGAFSNAWMLNHDCDRIDHAPGFPRAGNFHKERTYSFVGPAAGFNITPTGPTEAGPVALESVRRVNLPMAGAIPSCVFEERVAGGQLTTIQDLCLCRPQTASPLQYHQTRFDVQGGCGTNVTSAMGAFPKSFISKCIGFWSDATTYPGIEFVRWNIGGYTYTDACTAATRQEFFYGVTTIRGFTPFMLTNGGVGPQLPFTFIDQGNSLRTATGPLIMNVDHLSDHIININLN